MLIGLHQYDRALVQAETEAAIDPRSQHPHVKMARIYWIEGRVSDALAEDRKVVALAHLPVGPRDLDEVAAGCGRSANTSQSTTADRRSSDRSKTNSARYWPLHLKTPRILFSLASKLGYRRQPPSKSRGMPGMRPWPWSYLLTKPTPARAASALPDQRDR
jgi:hypothetical protein